MSLTVKRVDKLLRSGEPGRHLDEKGLYLVIGGKASAHWELRYQLHRRGRYMGLGSARTFTLDQARARAKREREKLADKVDPLAVRRAERATQAAAAAKVLTFSEAAQLYHSQHEAGWTNPRSAAQFLSTLKQHAFPHLGALIVAEISTPHVLAVLEQKVEAFKGNPAGPFWTARTTTADRVRNRIQLVLDWCTVRGHRPAGLPNPARWTGHLSEVLPSPSKVARVIHHPAVPYAEIPVLMAQLAGREGVAVKALMFAILTAARTGEVIGAKWDEIVDLDERAMWAVPGTRIKARKPHRAPLSTAAVQLLQNVYREDGNPFVFVGMQAGVGLSDTALSATLRRVGRNETVHGFRSAFTDWAHERTNHSNHEIELSLAHTIGNDVERAYRRGDPV